MLRRVVLHGELAEEFGKEHKIAVKSFHEAIRAINCRRPGFKQAIKKDAEYALVRGRDLNTIDDLQTKGKQLSEDEFKMGPVFDSNEDFHIVPVAAGQKNQWFQIILGVILVVVAIYFPPAALSAGQVLSLGMAGAGMILSGVAGLLSPAPSLSSMNYNERENPEDKPSYIFNGATNTTEQGTIISLVYGESFIGSKTVSARLDST